MNLRMAGTPPIFLLDRNALLRLLAAVLMRFILVISIVPTAQAKESTQTRTAARKTPSSLGTIKSIAGNNLVITCDAGIDVPVVIQDSAKFVRVEPGQKDLKDAQPIQMSELQVGDRVVARGKFGDDGKTLAASMIIVMKKADIANKQSQERDEWQKSGVSGLVNNVSAGGDAIAITVPSLRDKQTLVIHISKQTVLRRYAPASIKFDDARPAPLGQVKPGDQLRARGTRIGNEMTAEEIVSGSFRNISGTVSALDNSQETITVRDLVTKKSIAIKLTPDSQIRKIPTEIAQRIAIRLNGTAGLSNQTPSKSSSAAAPTAKDLASEPRRRPDSAAEDRGATGADSARGPGGSGRAGSSNLQQMISRLPAGTLADLHQGDAVMLVATEGTDTSVTAITLLAGVEPILQGSSSSAAPTILTPWSLSGAPGGEAGSAE